ncbi:DUF4214 domain-containing protein [Cellulomonas sp. McL0617]|uniref:DUF4214 domain-containing protein n=1 Tax=Cellulomonas sp. McL0617 TaxID=3415675 RepID=UPI003CE6E045
MGAFAVVAALGVAVSGPASAESDVQRQQFVTAVYQDLFGRAPDPTGLAGWTAALRSGTPRVAVANAITHSHEFRATLITDTYLKYLGRGPDPAGLQSWLVAMDGGATISQISAGFIASDEYYARSHDDPIQWVGAMYHDVLGRAASAQESIAWSDPLVHGKVSRTAIAMGILLSEEHLAPVVAGYYQQLLGRGLDPTGRRSWISLLQAGTHDEDIIGGIVASYEYWTNNVTALDVPPPPVDPNPPVRIYVSGATTTAGAHAALTAVLVDAAGYALRDVTGQTTFTISAGGTCSASSCWATAAGDYKVTGTAAGFSSFNTLHVDHGPAVSSVLLVAGLSAPGGTVPTGASPAVTVTPADAFGNHWDATAEMTVTLDAHPCAETCGPVTAGTHTVSAVPTAGSSVPGPTAVTLVGKAPTVAGERLFQFGIDSNGVVTGPTQVGTGTWWTSIAASDYQAMILRSDGSVWSAPVDSATPTTSVVPAWVPGTGTSQTASSIFALTTGSFAVFSPGGLKAWGTNADGEMGTGTPDAQVTAPTAVVAPAGTTWQSIVGDENYTLGLTSAGELWAWGDNSHGTFGDLSASRGVPARVGTAHWKSVAAGWLEAVGVRSDGTLWRWGQTPDVAGPITPQQVGTATDWASVDGDFFVFGALTTTKELWTWSESTWDPTPPRRVTAPATWNKLSMGLPAWTAIASDGSLWTGNVDNDDLTVRMGTDVGWTDLASMWGSTFALRP